MGYKLGNFGLYELKTLYFPGFWPKMAPQETKNGRFWAEMGEHKSAFFSKTPFLAKKGHFWPPEGLFLAKNLENKVFSVHTIQNLTFWNPNVAPRKVENFGPTDPPLPPLTPPRGPGGQKWPKCIPSSPLMIVNAKKAISGGSKMSTYFFTRNVPDFTAVTATTFGVPSLILLI